MDRAYLDFARLHRFHLAGALFVTRTRADIQMHRRSSRAVDKSTGLRSDQTVLLTTTFSRSNYPEPLRRIRFYDVEQRRSLGFLTNCFDLPALTIAHLYKSRWKVELFFKWIKQHLRIKAFYGTSENAVKTQLWIAIAIYVLVAILKKRLALDATLHQILQVLSITLFEKTPILRAFDDTLSQPESPSPSNQLNLIGF
jgi:transposase